MGTCRWIKACFRTYFQLAQKIIELNGIDLPRTSKKKKTIDISLWYKCKDLRELQSADELKNVQQIKNAKSRTIVTCDLSEPLTKINDCGFVCCQHTCAFKVAGYLYYLKYTCQEEKIFADRQYYKEHEQEILTKIEEYAVFIRMGSTGGNQATAQDAIQVYGQWNGTNLS